MSTPDAPTQTPSLWLVGLLGCLVYAAFLIFYSNPVWSEPRLNREIFVWIGGLGSLGCYIWGYQLVRRGASLYSILGFAAAFCLLALFTPPFHSTDVYGYINRGWEQLHYNMNPYVHPVGDIPGWGSDPMITDHWVNNPSPYGFLYMIIARVLTFFGQGQLWLTTLVFKFGNILLLLAAAATIKKAHPEPTDLNRVLYLFLWNPLLLIHGIMNGHNDLWMGYFILLALYFVRAEKNWVWVLPCLTAATLIKYGAAVIVPFWLVFLVRNKAYRVMFESMAISAVLIPIFGFPYLGEWKQFGFTQIEKNAQVTHSSLHALFYHLWKTFDDLIPALQPYYLYVRKAIQYLIMLGYAIIYFLMLNQLARTPSKDRFIFYGLMAVFLLIGFVSLKFYPWYLLMVFPGIFLMSVHHPMRKLLVILTCTHLLSITLIGQAHMVNYGLMMLAPIAWVWWRRNQNQEQEEALA